MVSLKHVFIHSEYVRIVVQIHSSIREMIKELFQRLFNYHYTISEGLRPGSSGYGKRNVIERLRDQNAETKSAHTMERTIFFR